MAQGRILASSRAEAGRRGDERFHPHRARVATSDHKGESLNFAFSAGLLAGLSATLVASLFAEATSAVGMTRMPPMSLVLGTFFTGDRDRAMRVGTGIYFLVVGSLVFGLVYAVVFSLFDIDSWWLVGLIGMAHGAAVGVGLDWIRFVHPRIFSATRRPETIGTSQVARGDIGVVDPGIFGVNWGDWTPVVIVASYVLYSFVFAAVYRWLV